MLGRRPPASIADVETESRWGAARIASEPVAKINLTDLLMTPSGTHVPIRIPLQTPSFMAYHGVIEQLLCRVSAKGKPCACCSDRDTGDKKYKFAQPNSS